MRKNKNIEEDFVELQIENLDGADSTGQEDSAQVPEEVKEAMEAINQFADDEGEDDDRLSFRKILGGDILLRKGVVKQVIFICFCVILLLCYTGNRYSSLQDIIVIDNLNAKFKNVHNKVLAQSSELLNKQRQSSIEKRLLEAGDTNMLNNNTPPFALPEKPQE